MPSTTVVTMPTHLISLNDLSRTQIQTLFKTTAGFQQNISNHCPLPSLSDKTVVLMFNENSTRTTLSFQIASHRLGCITLTTNMSSSSLNKGESWLDTIQNLEAMGVDMLILRDTSEQLAPTLAAQSQSIHVINAGNGCADHPSQVLLDLYTLTQQPLDITQMKITIVGDIIHSRVARSLIDGLLILGCQHICLCCPEEFTPKDLPSDPAIRYETVLDSASINANVIYTLRIQKERIDALKPNFFTNYLKKYQLQKHHLDMATKNVMLMHPGPVNWGVEIAKDLHACKQSLILQQVKNGIAIRMAIIDNFLRSKY